MRQFIRTGATVRVESPGDVNYGKVGVVIPAGPAAYGNVRVAIGGEPTLYQPTQLLEVAA
jgi:hypothetical protein